MNSLNFLLRFICLSVSLFYQSLFSSPTMRSIRGASEEDEKKRLIEEVRKGLAMLEDVFKDSSKGKGFYGGDQIGLLNTNKICSGKKEIVERVRNIGGLKTPVVVYLAVADKLLNNSSILEGWEDGFVPFEKKKLGVDGIYKKYPYLIQSAIDYEVCLRADTFVGNSFSTFSSLIVLERTQKMIRMNGSNLCGENVRWPSYAYNIPGTSNGPKRWITNMSESNLQSISYGTYHISC